VVARQIFELDPYRSLSLFHAGLTTDNLDDFLLGDPPLDVVVDECDDLRMKILLRERARSLSLPVLMETSDRGMLDVERFDRDPRRPLFHGALGAVTGADLPPTMSPEEKVRLVLPIVGAGTCSARSAAAMVEIGASIST